MRSPHRHRLSQAGFTLTELMITVVIVAILASIAYPTYRNQVIDSRRPDGKAALTETAQALERCYTQYNSYTHANCSVSLPVTSEEAYYVVSAATLTATQFTLEAAPQGPQTDDTECADLKLDHTGTKEETGTGTVDDCW